MSHAFAGHLDRPHSGLRRRKRQWRLRHALRWFGGDAIRKYTLAVQAASGSVTATQAITLTVQQRERTVSIRWTYPDCNGWVSFDGIKFGL
jgi:hypothetical protein